MTNSPPDPLRIPSRRMVRSASTPPRSRQPSTSRGLSLPEVTSDMSREELYELAKNFRTLYYEETTRLRRELESLSGICDMQASQLQQERIRALAAGLDVEDPTPVGIPSVPGSQVLSRTSSRETPERRESATQQNGSMFASRDLFVDPLERSRSTSQRLAHLPSITESPKHEEAAISRSVSFGENVSIDEAVATEPPIGGANGISFEESEPDSVPPPDNDYPPSPPQSELLTHMAGRTPPPQILRIDPSELSGVQTPLAVAPQLDGPLDLSEDPALTGPLTLRSDPSLGQDTLTALDKVLAKVASDPEHNLPFVAMSSDPAKRYPLPGVPKGTEASTAANGLAISRIVSGTDREGRSAADAPPAQTDKADEDGDGEHEIKLRTRKDTSNFGLPLGQVARTERRRSADDG